MLKRLLTLLPLFLLLLALAGSRAEANQTIANAITVTNTTTSSLNIPRSSGIGMVIVVNVTSIGAGDTWTLKAQYLDSNGTAQDLTSTSSNITGTGYVALTLASPYSLASATPTPVQMVATRSVNGGTPTLTYQVTSFYNAQGPPLYSTPTEIIVTPSQGGAGINAACTAASAAATSTSPRTIRLLQGVYGSDTTLSSCTNMNYVSVIGAGMDQTIIRANTAVFTTASAADTDFWPMGNTRNGTVSGLTIDVQTNDPLNLSTNTHLLAAVNQCVTDATGVSFTWNEVHILGDQYGWWCSAGNASTTVKMYLYSSKFEATGTALRIGGEHWLAFNSELRGTDPNEANTYFGTDITAVTAPAVGLVLGVTSATDWWGCHIHGETKKTTTALGPKGINETVGTSSSLHTFSGCTIHSVSSAPAPPSNVSTSNANAAAIAFATVGSVSTVTNINGSQLIYKTPVGQTGFRTGGIVINCTGCSGATVMINGGAFIDDGGGTTVATKVNSIEGQRGDIVYTPTSGTPTTIKLNGVRRVNGVSSPINFSTLAGPDSWTNGTLTLSSGAAIVSWITDAGAAGGTPVFSTASASVTGGTAIDTTFMPGQFIKIGTDPAACWTRIKTVDSSTALTLTEVYGGGRTGCTSATAASNQGTLTANTTSDSAFRVTLLPTSAPAASEVFYTIDKYAGGFTAKSSSGASTLTLDYTVSR